MAFGDVDIKVDFIGTMSGVPTFTRFQYFGDTVAPSPFSNQFLDAAIARIWTNALKQFTSENFLLSRVECSLNQLYPAPNAVQSTKVVNEVGLVVGESLPSFCTFSIVKIPDQNTITPAGQPAFRAGRIGWPGVPETSQDSGILNPAEKTTIDGFLFSQVLTVNANIGNGAEDFNFGYARSADSLVGGNPVTKVACLNATVAQEIGSQVSRKF